MSDGDEAQEARALVHIEDHPLYLEAYPTAPEMQTGALDVQPSDGALYVGVDAGVDDRQLEVGLFVDAEAAKTLAARLLAYADSDEDGGGGGGDGSR